MTLRMTDSPQMCHPVDILTRGPIRGRSWHAAHTKPRQEKALARNLKKIGINYYLPLMKQKQKSENRQRYSFVPLFAGYLFFRGDAGDRIAAFKTDRIVRIIDVSDQNQLVKELNIIHAALTYRSVGVYNSEIRPGVKVRITDGPLKGAEGTVLSKKNMTEVIIHIKSVHQSLRIDVRSDKTEVI